MRLQDLATSYCDVIPKPFADWLAAEDAATELRYYEPLLIPGPLQTEEYAVAVATVFGAADPARVAEARMLRAGRLLRPDGPRLRVVVDEAVLRRQMGGVEVMGAQVAYLRRLVDVGRVEVRVVPFVSGVLVRDPFAYASAPDGGVAFLEHARGDALVRGPAADRYAAMFDDLWAQLGGDTPEVTA